MITKKILLLIVLILIKSSYSQTQTYFIKYKSEVEKSSIEQKISSQQISNSIKKTSPSSKEYSITHFARNLGKDDEILSRIIKITFANQDEAHKYLQQIQNDNTVEYVQPSVTYQVETVPNDSLVKNQWALEKIEAFNAWNITTGSDTVLLAIIDTGVEFFHPDLKNNIFYNKGETGTDLSGNDKRTNNIDDDGNGFIDDYMGWDFTDRVGFPNDTLSGDFIGWDNYPYDPVPGQFGYHGTFVAGIAAAQFNNSIGIAGIAPGIKILNVRSFTNTGGGEEDDAAAAILYSIKMGAKIINMSWGDSNFSYVLRDVIKYAYSRGVVLIGSSGNSGSSAPHYPSGYTEVISVGNTDSEDRVASNSNYGSTLDLVAPGVGIQSTDLGGGYTYSSGTSASAPFVSATAALILSLKNFTNEEVKQILKSTADDIGQTGWDLKSGAGRLNMLKALTILSPAKVKFNYPHEDFATLQDTLNINVTVMSPYFVKYDLLYGEGLNPDKWNNLITDVKNQALNNSIFTQQLSQLAEGDYTLRLVVSLNTGGTTEERVNFHIQRTASEIELVGAGPIYYGNKSTIMGEVYTGSLAITRMYYREKGSREFKFITLDGFATNNQFVKQEHYGFIPKQLVQPNTTYEVYFEAENLVGLKSMLKDEGNNYFEFRTDPLNEQITPTTLPYTLPKGAFFDKPVNILSNNFSEILFDEFNESQNSVYNLYQLNNNILIKKDSIVNKFPVAVSDFNKDGKNDLLSSFQRTGFIDEINLSADSLLKNKLTSTKLFPLFAEDIFKDGKYEILSNSGDSTFSLYRINDKLGVDTLSKLKNFSFVDNIDRSLGNYNNLYKNAVVADLNGDGKNEIWFVDSDGDILSYKQNSSNDFVPGDSIDTYFRVNNNYIMDNGDFDGDGTDDIAIIMNSASIANYFFVMVFNFKNNRENILYQKIFLDQSTEYRGFGFAEIYQSLKLVDIDNDNKAELVLNIYPYLYIIKNTNAGNKIIYYDEDVNTESIFVGDLNQNGVTEIALQKADGYKFYEFAPSLKPNLPTNLSGFSIDSTTINLQWSGNVQKYLIYKGTEKSSLLLYDSTLTSTYSDSNVILNKNYYYSIKAVDPTKQIPVSELSNIIEVYSHYPGKVISVTNNSLQSVTVIFSERVTNTIENLGAFDVAGIGIPNSVTAASQFSYLLSFKQDLPAGENKITVKDLRDYYGSPIREITIPFNVVPVSSSNEFFISAHEILNPYLIKVIFNSEVNEASALNISNYSFDPVNKVASVTVDPADKKIIYISLVKERPVGSIGREYRLQIENIVSSGGLKINSGAGSYIVLTGYARDLSDVYVYPSPVKLKSGNEKMMFANIPQKAKITIFSIDGKQLFNLEERDGNGGVEYDLKDDSGNLINSGIYIYRIIRLDNDNNEVEEKIGKFAVIR